MKEISPLTTALLAFGLFMTYVEVTEGALLPPMRANCSTITPSEKVGCVVPEGTNKTMCTFLGCCWDGGESNVQKRCYTKRGGTCMRYQGEACHVSFNSTLTSYSDSPRFFDNKYWLPATEKFLANGIKIIKQLVTNNEKCRYIMINLLCHYTVPPCYSDGVNIDYCRGDCQAIFNDCSTSLNQVIGAITVYVAQTGIDFIHTGLPNCSRHKTVQYYEDKPNRTCIKTEFFNYTEVIANKTGLFNNTEEIENKTGFFTDTKALVKTNKPTSATDDKNLDIILPIFFVCLFIIVVCVIVFILWRRRQKKRDAMDNAHVQGSMTMRDRLRAESLKSLDSSLLCLYDPNKLKQYNLDHVQYVKDLGEGFFGKVFQGKTYGLIGERTDAELLVAVKTLKEGSSTEAKEDFFREAALMSVLHHENIVKLLAVSTDEEPYGMIFEFMDLGDLNQYLRKAGPFFEGDEKEKVSLTADDLMSISLQCAAGMEHLQMLRFVHRDVATRNCLVGTGLIVKIADFGMSRDIYTSDYYKVEGKRMLPIRWMPPEALLLGKFTVESDIYSFGVLLWEIYTLALQPYYGYTNEEVLEFIKQGIILGQPDDCPDHVYQIMKSCWLQDASQRPNFTLMIAQLKQEVTSPTHSPDHPLPVHDKQSFYQNIGFSPEQLKEIPSEKKPTQKISDQGSGTPESGHVQPSSGYVNVALNLGVV